MRKDSNGPLIASRAALRGGPDPVPRQPAVAVRRRLDFVGAVAYVAAVHVGHLHPPVRGSVSKGRMDPAIRRYSRRPVSWRCPRAWT